MKKDMQVILEEVCDCGSHIRHNNGGNYHDTHILIRRKEKLFTKIISSYEDATPEIYDGIKLPSKEYIKYRNT